MGNRVGSSPTTRTKKEDILLGCPLFLVSGGIKNARGSGAAPARLRRTRGAAQMGRDYKDILKGCPLFWFPGGILIARGSGAAHARLCRTRGAVQMGRDVGAKRTLPLLFHIEPAAPGFDLVFFGGNHRFCIAIRAKNPGRLASRIFTCSLFTTH